MARVSKHARARLDERLSVGEQPGAKLAERALASGLEARDVAGSLRRYLDGCMMRHPGKLPRIYGEHVYVFAGATLVTVFPLPSRFRAVVAKARARKSST